MNFHYAKRPLAATLVASFLLFGIGDAAAHAMTVEGTIAAATFDWPLGGLTTRHARCAWLAGGDAANGLVGWVVTLPEDAVDGAHMFTLTSNVGDPAVVFYGSLGTCDSIFDGPWTLETHDNPGAEYGGIPEDSAYAIIVIRDANAAQFTFTVN